MSVDYPRTQTELNGSRANWFDYNALIAAIKTMPLFYLDTSNTDGDAYVIKTPNTNRRTALQLIPNGTPTGEWTTNFSMLDAPNKYFEISFSNHYLIFNSFDGTWTSGATPAPQEMMWMMNSQTVLHAYWNAGLPYVDLQSAHVATGDGFQVHPDIGINFQQYTTGHLHTKIYLYHDDNLVFENLTDASIKFSVGATPVNFIFDYLGQAAIPTRILFGGGYGAAVQSTLSAGTKIDLFNNDHKYEIGINASELWMKADGGFKWYYNTGPANIMALTSAGVLQPVTVKPTTSYESTDGTAGATADVAVAKVGGGTRTLSFKNGLYTGYTDS